MSLINFTLKIAAASLTTRYVTFQYLIPDVYSVCTAEHTIITLVKMKELTVCKQECL